MSERTRDRLLFQLKTKGAQTTADLARRVSMSTVAVRQHLSDLEVEGLVGSHRESRGRAGRPTAVWQLRELGHAAFPDNHADLTLEILAAARQAFGDQGIEQIIDARAALQRERYREVMARARTIRQRVAALARLRRQEGYMAEWKASGRGFVLAENHCPICAAARTCQGLCRQELELFQDVLGSECHVERTEHLFDGARRCAYRVTPKNAP